MRRKADDWMNQVLILGAGGHAKVVADLVELAGYAVAGFLDDHPAGPDVFGKPVLGPIADCLRYPEHAFVIGIGSNRVRRELAARYPLRWITAVHPKAVVARDAVLGPGTVVMANAVVNPGAAVGAHAIVNTGAIVEHDNVVGDFVHLSPGCALGGTVTVGAGTHGGIGACVRNNVCIAPDCVVGAGAVVVTDLKQTGTYVGCPAKRLNK